MNGHIYAAANMSDAPVVAVDGGGYLYVAWRQGNAVYALRRAGADAKH